MTVLLITVPGLFLVSACASALSTDPQAGQSSTSPPPFAAPFPQGYWPQQAPIVPGRSF